MTRSCENGKRLPPIIYRCLHIYFSCLWDSRNTILPLQPPCSSNFELSKRREKRFRGNNERAWRDATRVKRSPARFAATLNFPLIPEGIGSIPLVAVRGPKRVGIRNRRGPSVKLLFRPTFTPALAGVTFDWTATLNWFRLKSHPPSSTSATHSSPSFLSLFLSRPGSLFATLAFLFSHSLSLSLSRSRFLCLRGPLPLRLFLSRSPAPSPSPPPSSLRFRISSGSLTPTYRERERERETRAKCISIRAIFYRSHLRVRLRNGGGEGWGGKGWKKVSTDAKRRERVDEAKKKKRERRLISQGNATREQEKVMPQSITSNAISLMRAPSKFLQFRHRLRNNARHRLRFRSPSREPP